MYFFNVFETFQPFTMVDFLKSSTSSSFLKLSSILKLLEIQFQTQVGFLNISFVRNNGFNLQNMKTFVRVHLTDSVQQQKAYSAKGHKYIIQCIYTKGFRVSSEMYPSSIPGFPISPYRTHVGMSAMNGTQGIDSEILWSWMSNGQTQTLQLAQTLPLYHLSISWPCLSC